MSRTRSGKRSGGGGAVPEQPRVTAEELGQQLQAEAHRLRSLAEVVRSDGTPPDLTQYVKTGRGPAYQRDSARWVRRLGVAYAFDAAAARLEEELRSLRG